MYQFKKRNSTATYYILKKIEDEKLYSLVNPSNSILLRRGFVIILKSLSPLILMANKVCNDATEQHFGGTH